MEKGTQHLWKEDTAQKGKMNWHFSMKNTKYLRRYFRNFVKGFEPKTMLNLNGDFRNTCGICINVRRHGLSCSC